MILNEQFVENLVESDKYGKVDPIFKGVLSNLLLNEAKLCKGEIVDESSLAGDIATFTPILMPLVRRVFPNLIANELLGVQPMSTPTGYIYALVNNYIGDGLNQANPNRNAFVVETDFVPVVTDGVVTQANLDVTVGSTIFSTGKVLYVEGGKVLVGYTGTTRPAVKVGDTVKEGVKVTGLYTNEAAFYRIFKNYTGTYQTAVAEQLGDDMKEVGFSVTKKSIEAKSRALKGRYTVEMYQDLKSQHGLDADQELISLMSYEIQAETDRDVVDFVNNNSKVCPDVTFQAPTVAAVGRGVWDIENYRALGIRIAKESALVGLETKRGQGNILLVSPKVEVMLEQLGGFKPFEVASDLQFQSAGGVAGTFDNKYKVIVDQYAKNDYVNVIYKGADRRDAMGFFAPYVPLSFTKVTMQESGQPGVIAKTRYALATIPGVSDPNSNDRAQAYAHQFTVDATNTLLAGAGDYKLGAI
jgi:hypothetical protein